MKIIIFKKKKDADSERTVIFLSIKTHREMLIVVHNTTRPTEITSKF